MALTPSTRENGCMSVVPGSHRFGSFGGLVPKSEDSKDLLSVRQKIEFTFDEARDPRPVELQPGQFSVHSGLTLHGGSPNPTGSDRIVRHHATATIDGIIHDFPFDGQRRSEPWAFPIGPFTVQHFARSVDNFFSSADGLGADADLGRSLTHLEVTDTRDGYKKRY